MRITIVQGAFLPVPPLMGGAVEKVWFALGKEFAQRGHQVTHISRCYENLPQDEIIDGVRYLRVPGFDTPKSITTLKFFDFIYSLRVLKILPKADILVTNTFWLPILSRNLAHGLVYVHVARYPKGQMKLYKHVARLQTVSSPIAEAIKQEAPQSISKVRVIPYPRQENIGIHQQQPLNEQEKIILYVGRIHPEKGIEILIHAFQKLVGFGFHDWKLVIVGPWETKLGGGGNTYYQHLRSQAQALGDKIEWVGSVFDPLKLQSYYRQAKLFVYPSLAERGETFGLAALEAMSHECATLVSNLKCFQDYITDGKTGFIFDHQSKDPVVTLAEKIKMLISSQSQLEKIGHNGYKKSLEYTLPRIADLYLSDFTSLIQV